MAELVTVVIEDELILPLPGVLVASDQEHVSVEVTAAALALASIPPGAPAHDTHAVLDPIAREILARWRAMDELPQISNPLQAEYDRYFRVRRVETTAPLAAFYEATVIAYYRLLAESLEGHSLTPVELGYLRGALEGVLLRLQTPDRSPASRSLRRPAVAFATPPRGQVDVLRRWVRGHHAFFVMIQALLLAHEWLSRAMRSGEPARIQAMLNWATELWWAAGAAFRFAGDFEQDLYATIVRPSMCPPHVSDGFSGLHSPDHTELMGQLKASRAALDDRCLTHPVEHRSYLSALSSVYDSHVYVCEEFVGNGPSLKGTASRYGSNATAVLGGPLKQRAMAHAGAPSVVDED